MNFELNFFSITKLPEKTGKILKKLGQQKVNFTIKNKIVVLLTLRNVAVSLEYEFWKSSGTFCPVLFQHPLSS